MRHHEHASCASDALSALLPSVHIRTGDAGHRVVTPPFGVTYPAESSGVKIVADGNAAVRDGDAWRRLERGAVLLWLPGARVAEHDSPNTPADPIRAAVATRAARGHPPGIPDGASGSFAFVGAALRIETRTPGSVLPALPRVIVRHRRESQRLADACALLQSHAGDTTDGAAAFCSSIVRAIVSEVLRLATVEAGGSRPGSNDPAIGPVLALVHADPARPWSIGRLATEAGMSRTVFCETFRARVGVPPGRYIRGTRLGMAAGLLRETNHDVGTIGRRVGYASEGAFCAAFRAWAGTTPSAYRLRAADDGLAGNQEDDPGLRPGAACS